MHIGLVDNLSIRYAKWCPSYIVQCLHNDFCKAHIVQGGGPATCVGARLITPRDDNTHESAPPPAQG